MSGAVHAHGTVIQVSDAGGTPVYTSFAEVVNVLGPNVVVDKLDVTHMESPSAWREFIAGLKDGTEISILCNLLMDATQEDKFDNLGDAARTYRIVWPDVATSFTFTADTSTNVLTTASNHGWNTVQPVRCTSSGTIPAGITANRVYFATRTAADGLKLYPTSADAIADTNAVDITTTGSGTHTVKTGQAATFSAFCSGFAPVLPVTDKATLNLTLKLSGAITLVPSS